jgi:hypothetical protein
MQRIEINVTTGERKVIELTAEEIAQGEIRHQAWLAEKEAVEAAQPTKEELLAQIQALVAQLEAK